MDALTGGADREELRALLLLDRLPEVGPARLRAIVDRFGSARQALRARRSSFAAVAGHTAASARANPESAVEVERALDAAQRAGMRVLTWSAPDYPSRLRHLVDPPPVLFLRGRVELLDRPSVTIVGARRATARGREVAERLGAGIAGAGVTVTSGLALGIDQAAHRGALAGQGDTIAVLGTGADVPYPRAHYGLFERIAEVGLLVSEFVPGTPALPHHFPRRNRILAALGVATVVVEAGARSGSLITVDHALDLGREVWVVPGPIERPTSVGSNALLLEGARPLLSVAHFVGELTGRPAVAERPGLGTGAAAGPGRAGRAGRLRGEGDARGGHRPPFRNAEQLELASPRRGHPDERSRSPADELAVPGPAEELAIPVPAEGLTVPAEGLAPPAERIAPSVSGPDALLLGALSDGALTGDQVAERTGLPVQEALHRLTALELSGVVRRLPGMRFGSAA